LNLRSRSDGLIPLVEPDAAPCLWLGRSPSRSWSAEYATGARSGVQVEPAHEVDGLTHAGYPEDADNGNEERGDCQPSTQPWGLVEIGMRAHHTIPVSRKRAYSDKHPINVIERDEEKSNSLPRGGPDISRLDQLPGTVEIHIGEDPGPSDQAICSNRRENPEYSRPGTTFGGGSA